MGGGRVAPIENSGAGHLDSICQSLCHRGTANKDVPTRFVRSHSLTQRMRNINTAVIEKCMEVPLSKAILLKLFLRFKMKEME